MMNYRNAAVAGQFYPKDPDKLQALLDELFRRAEADFIAEKHPVSGLIAPHAGYIFSGLQAAKAYRYIKDTQYKIVCILSPNHREYFSGITVYSGVGYRTPLGDCPVNTEARNIALSCKGILASELGHRSEHALEVQLPFIQYALDNVSILPIVMGDQSEESIREAEECVRTLYRQYKQDILFVASSDLSHFHSAAEAREMDEQFINILQNWDDAGILQHLRLGTIEACGGGPIIALLRGLEKEQHFIRVLGYSHSGEVLHDDSEVVGYTSAVILYNESKIKKGNT